MMNKFMGPEEYRKFIREMPEDTLRERIIESMRRFDKNLVKGSFDSLIDLLKTTGLHLNCIRRTTPEEARKFLAKLLNCLNIKDRNIDETLNYIIASSTFYPQRISDWNVSEIEVITNNQEKMTLKRYYAEFKQIDNWKRELGPETYEIICHENQILWHMINPDLAEPHYFVMKNKKIYGLSIRYPYGRDYQSILIIIWDNLHAIHNDIFVTLDTLDEIKEKYENDKRFDETQLIELYDDSYEVIIYDSNGKKSDYETKITGFAGDYLKIETINLTYSLTGYILLDIENNIVIEAKKYDGLRPSP